MIRRSLMKSVIDNGLRINKKSSVYYKTYVPIKDTHILVSMQVTKYSYRRCSPHTYNTLGAIVVIVINNQEIVIVPNTNFVRNALRTERYTIDHTIFVPNISLSTLEDPKQSKKWALALTRLS